VVVVAAAVSTPYVEPRAVVYDDGAREGVHAGTSRRKEWSDCRWYPAAAAPVTAARPPMASAINGKPSLPTPLSVSDELASFAMSCAVGGGDACFHPSELWSPLRFNEATGKLEARAGSGLSWHPDGGRGVVEADEMYSPIEPGLSKRDVSFSTQMVRRAVSFVFADGMDDPASPLQSRKDTHSPHTAPAAIAA